MPSSVSHVVHELNQAGSFVATYSVRGGTAGPDAPVQVSVPREARSWSKLLLDAFLPAGYPGSVTGDYLEYQIYDSLQAFSSSIAGLLSSRAVLEGIGVGNAHASPTAALLLSVLQESTGRIGTIVFASRLGTSLEPECKMWRLAADVFNDLAMVLDCLSPVFPRPARVLVLSASSVLRALCGVAAGSAKASLSAHFATKGNLGEVNAKDSSQETIISLLGMLAGSVVVSYITSPRATWLSLLLLLGIHLAMNYLAVRAVVLRTLNRQRATILFATYLESRGDLYGSSSQDRHGLKVQPRKRAVVLSPAEVAAKERILTHNEGSLRNTQGRRIGSARIGVPFGTILTAWQAQKTAAGDPIPRSLEPLFADPGAEEYILHAPTAECLIGLKERATAETQLKAWFHALYHCWQGQAMCEDLREEQSRVDVMWDELREGMRSEGWDLEHGALETRSGMRIRVGGGRKGI